MNNLLVTHSIRSCKRRLSVVGSVKHVTEGKHTFNVYIIYCVIWQNSEEILTCENLYVVQIAGPQIFHARVTLSRTPLHGN